MRIIKLALISVVLIFALVTAISLMIPTRVRISKATNLMATRETVLSQVRKDSNWSRWHPAYMDTASRRQWEAAEKKVLADTDSTFVVQLTLKDRKPVISGWEVYQYAGADSLTLQWYMDFHLSWYPWEKFSSLFFEKSYGVMMEQGLMNLREEVQGFEH